MTNNMKNPVKRGGAHRVDHIKTVCAEFDRPELIIDPLAFQAVFVANRYGLSPCMARLVCHLAQIGGRLV